MAHVRQDFRYALRSLAKTPGFTATAVIIIALGIGANTATVTLANALLFRPLAGGSDVVSLHSRDRTTPDSYRHFSYPNYAEIRDRSGLFDALMAHTFTMVGLDSDEGGGRRRVLASVVSANYFDVLGATLAAGRPFTLDEERPGARIPVAIASHAYWTRRGLDPGVLGSHLTINADTYTIVGVAPEGFSGSMAIVAPNVYLPLGMFDAVVNDRFKNNGRGLADRANAGLAVVGRLKPGLESDFVSARLEVLSQDMEASHPAENRHQTLSVQALSRFSAGPTPQDNTAIGAVTALLLGLSGTVLVIACLNIANMLLARGTARRKELAVRLALGAGRARLIRQLLAESTVLAAAGASLGLVLSYWATSAVAAAIAGALPFTLTVRATPDATVLMATVALAAFGTIAFGLGPALKLSRRDLVVDLRDRGSEGALTRRLFGTRNVLVIGQVALSLALLTAGGIFARTAVTAAAARPGYSYDGLVVASVDTTLAGLDPARGRLAHADLLARVRALPGVAAASIASTVPFGDSVESGRFERVGSDQGATARAFRITGADYFRMLGLSLVRGREFTLAEETSATAPRVAIVDVAFAQRLYGDQDPIGQTIRTAPSADGSIAPGEWMEIVGVAPPIKEELLDRAAVPHVYVPLGRNFRGGMHVQVRLAPGVDERAAEEALAREIRAVDARLPVLTLQSMQAFHDRGLELWALRAGAGLFTGLGILALVLAAVGVYGVRSYMVEQRTREIGIRMALGATARDVLRLVLSDGLRLTSVGVGVGIPLAVLVSLVFRSVFVDVGGIDPAVLAGATIVLSVAALLASAVPARRATKIQPVRALQAD